MRFDLVTRPVYIAVAALAAALVAGCGPTVFPVAGSVVLSDGQRLPPGTKLIFNPARGGTGVATALTAADGSFKVTHVSGANGAEPGSYTIVLAAPQGSQEIFFKTVPKAYYDGGNLYVEVQAGMQPLSLKVETARSQ